MTLVFSKTCAPPILAALAIASVVSTGFAIPSPGMNAAPTMPSVFTSGHSSPTRSGVMNSMSTPRRRAIEAFRRISSQRPSVWATRIEPCCTKPVESPVRRSTSRKRSFE